MIYWVLGDHHQQAITQKLGSSHTMGEEQPQNQSLFLDNMEHGHPDSAVTKGMEEETPSDELASSKQPPKRTTLLDDDDDEEEEENEIPVPTSTAATEGSVKEGQQMVTGAEIPLSSELLTDIAAYAATASDRFRNALVRVQSNPLTDVEAWAALLTEAQMGFRTELTKLQQLQQQARFGGFVDATTARLDFVKFDLLESIYGALLQHFPYSGVHYAGVIEMLMSVSALPDEHHGVIMYIDRAEAAADVGGVVLSKRRHVAEMKLTTLFQHVLGVNLDGTPYLDTETKQEQMVESAMLDAPQYKVRSGMCSHIPLWALYIQKVARDTNRKYSSIYDPFDARERMIQAYEAALSKAGFVVGCHAIWKQYVAFQSFTSCYAGSDITDMALPPPPSPDQLQLDPQTKHRRMLHLRSVFQRLIATPMQDLDTFWKEYETFERSISEALSQPLLAEHLPRYQHAKQVYIERMGYMSDLLPSVGRLAIPPENTEKERTLMSSFLTRVAYERTNPERLSLSDLSIRIRQAYKDIACVFMRHPEIWHEWSSWESSGHCGGGHALACEVSGLDQLQDLSFFHNILKEQNLIRNHSLFSLLSSLLPGVFLVTRAFTRLCSPSSIACRTSRIGRGILNSNCMFREVSRDFTLQSRLCFTSAISSQNTGNTGCTPCLF